MSNTTKKSPFLTAKEAAKFLRLEQRTLDNWRWAGKGPKFRKHGQLVVYLEEDLISYSEEMSGYSARF